MNYKWLALIILVSTACASCGEPCPWTQYLGNLGRTGYINCSGPDSPEVLWEITIDGGIETPFIIEDKVCIPYEMCTSGCSPGYFPTIETTVAVVDLLTGTLLQEIKVEDWLVSACPLGQKKILLVSVGMLYEIDLSSASISPISEVHVPSWSPFSPLRYPLILRDKIVIPDSQPTDRIVCFSRSDYRRLWDLKSSLGLLYPPDSVLLNIAASEDVVYLVFLEEETRIWAVHLATGTFIWMSEPLKVSEIAVDGSTLFAGGDKLYALDAETGKVLWTFGCASVESNISVGPDAVYVTDDMKLYAVDKYTGNLEWEKERENVGGLATTYLIGTENTIICSDVLNLTSFSAEDGTQLWNVHFQDYIDSFGKKPCPAVTEGILIVKKTEKGKKVVAFASDPELFVRQGDAFVSAELKEKAGDSYRKAATLYEKKGNLEKAEEIKKRMSELGLSLETQFPSPSASPPSSVSPSPEPSPLTKESALLITSIVAIIVFIMIITYYFVKRKQNKLKERL